MGAEDLDDFEADRELQLAHEYQDVSAMFRYAVETERRFYLANEVRLEVIGNGLTTCLCGRTPPAANGS